MKDFKTIFSVNTDKFEWQIQTTGDELRVTRMHKIMSLVEALAVLEHQQFRHWIGYQVENMHLINWERWTRQAQTPYAMLSEKEKESDREWARKVLKVIGKSHLIISREKLQDLMKEFPKQFPNYWQNGKLINWDDKVLEWFAKLKELVE